MDSARCSRCRGHTKTVSPDLFRGPILFNWALRRNWTPEQVRGDTYKCHSGKEFISSKQNEALHYVA